MDISKTSNTDTFTLTNQIEEYLRAHPSAADTAEGIANWWLTGFAINPGELKLVLSLLVDQGKLAAITSADGYIRYSRGKHAC